MLSKCAQRRRRSHVKKQPASFNAEKRNVSLAQLFAKSDIPQSHVQIEPLALERISVLIRKLDSLTEG